MNKFRGFLFSLSVRIDIIDCVLVDADFENGIFNWQDLTGFLKEREMRYFVFSSNGKVGTLNNERVISIKDINENLLKQIP